MPWENGAVLWNVLGYFLVLWLLQPCPSTKAVTVGRVVCWGCSLLLFSMPSAELVLLCLLPWPQMHPVWRDTPAFWYFPSSVLLCILCAQLPSNSVRRAQHFLCPTSSAGAAYPVQSSTTSERVFLHPKSIINTAKVFITLSKLWTLMASGVRGKAVRVNFMRKSLHLPSATECEFQFSQEPSQLWVIIFAF